MTDQDPTTDDVDIRHPEDKRRYEITVDGGLAGFTEYRDRDSRRVFFHTEIDEAYGGRGLATRLVATALADTIGEGRVVVPVCPLVAKYVAKHPELGDSVVTPTSDILEWLRQNM